MTQSSELTRRWAVAIVGVPVVVGLLYVGSWTLGIPLAMLAGLGALETYRLAEQRGTRPLRLLGASAAAAIVIEATAFPTFGSFSPWALATIGLLALLVAVVSMVTRWPKGHPLVAISVTVFGALYVGLPLAFVSLLHSAPEVGAWGPVMADPWTGLAVVALPLASTWIGDAAAFFAGTKWGRSKVLPRVSRAKSWVGSWTGLLGAAAAGAGWYVSVGSVLPRSPVDGLWTAAALGAALGVGAQLGDFIESLLKREAGVKDSGSIFPGHGGVLDRLDALVITLPLAYTLLMLLEHYG
ncbi:MAG: phosphatidate cytidylyltransferase [Gemmatimonadetes bacterium]|nr:phosphatidate cytidylyltransferase [Gemmatimonadota bacterium]